MEDTRADFTMTFRQLSDMSLLELQENSISQVLIFLLFIHICYKA